MIPRKLQEKPISKAQIIVKNIYIQINNDKKFLKSIRWPYIDTALTHFNKKDPSYDSLTSQKEGKSPDQKSRAGYTELRNYNSWSVSGYSSYRLRMFSTQRGSNLPKPKVGSGRGSSYQQAGRSNGKTESHDLPLGCIITLISQ